MRTANLAIVFTDIAGFTERTARQTHEENRRLLRAHEALLKPIFKSFGGRVIKAIGDAFLVVFGSPTDAVMCGAALQDRLWEWNKQADEGLRLDVRVAVNVGEVRLEGGDVFGAPVNVAARVETIAQSGEVLFTESVWRACEPSRLPAVDRGPHDLRGVPGQVRLFSLERSSSPKEPPYRGLGRRDFGPLPEISEAAERRALVSRLRTAAAVGALGLFAIMLGAGKVPAKQALVHDSKRPAQLAQADKQQPPPAIEAAPAKPPLATEAAKPADAQQIAAGQPKAAAPSKPAMAVKPIARRTAAKPRKVASAARVVEPPRPPIPLEAQMAFKEAEAAEGRRDFVGAAHRYERAALKGDERGRAKLVALLFGPKCEGRVQAAQSLARLGHAEAVPKLRAMIASEDLPHEGSGLTMFECSSKRAARDALRSLEARAGR